MVNIEEVPLGEIENGINNDDLWLNFLHYHFVWLEADTNILLYSRSSSSKQMDYNGEITSVNEIFENTGTDS